MHKNINSLSIDTLPPRKQAYADQIVSGLYLYVGPKRRRWFVRSSLDGEPRDTTLGFYMPGYPLKKESVGLAKAREMAREILARHREHSLKVKAAKKGSAERQRWLDGLASFGPVVELRAGNLDGDEGFVYCVSALGADRVKIGRARDVSNRLQGLRTGSPFDIRLVAAIPLSDPVAFERLLHGHLDRRRLQGEWFDDTDGVISEFFIAQGAEANFRMLRRIINLRSA